MDPSRRLYQCRWDLKFCKIPDEGVQTNVAAQAKWRNWEKEYTFPLTINGSVLPEGERAINQIKNVLLEKIEEQKTAKGNCVTSESWRLRGSLQRSGAEKKATILSFICSCNSFFSCFMEKRRKKKSGR